MNVLQERCKVLEKENQELTNEVGSMKAFLRTSSTAKVRDSIAKDVKGDSTDVYGALTSEEVIESLKKKNQELILELVALKGKVDGGTKVKEKLLKSFEDVGPDKDRFVDESRTICKAALLKVIHEVPTKVMEHIIKEDPHGTFRRYTICEGENEYIVLWKHYLAGGKVIECELILMWSELLSLYTIFLSLTHFSYLIPPHLLSYVRPFEAKG